jgi:phenylpropionate dioxygenase-like ring-hydroxylating dioxygenase large terminal subunit
MGLERSSSASPPGDSAALRDLGATAMSLGANVKPMPPARPDGGRLRQEWRTGEHGIPVARYIDRDFAKLEAEKLWVRVWQMACRLDQVSEPGDYMVYEILDQSILVVRVDETTIRAFHNVCPHRATALAAGAGRFQLETITCPFHGWKWNLNGENTFVLDRQEFMGGCLADDYLHLHECKVAEWMGSVWINLDSEAQPFEDHIAPIRALVDPILIDQMKFYWHKSIVVNANWKVAQEAFMEAYHVPQTHPQLAVRNEPAEFSTLFKYRTFPNGHALFTSGGVSSMGRVSPQRAMAMTPAEQSEILVKGLRAQHEGHDAQVHAEEVEIARTMRSRPIPEGSTLGMEFQRVIREHFAAQGKPIAPFEALQAVTDMHVFPHITFLPSYANLLMYRMRPTRTNDPDWCIFDMYALRTYPAGETPPKWETEYCTDANDPEQMQLIPRQDFANIPRQQQGLHSMAIKSNLLSERQEAPILNMHTELDKYLTA